MSKSYEVALIAAQGTIQAQLERLKAIEAENARIKQAWVEMYMYYSGQKWTDTPPTYEEVARAWGERLT